MRMDYSKKEPDLTTLESDSVFDRAEILPQTVGTEMSGSKNYSLKKVPQVSAAAK